MKLVTTLSFLTLSLLAMSSEAASATEVTKTVRNITFHGSVVLTSPFAMTNDDGLTYTGFSVDLLKQIQIFAQANGGKPSI